MVPFLYDCCRLAKNLEQHSVQAMENPEKYLSNPVIAFLMVKRFTSDWDKALDIYFNNSKTDSKWYQTGRFVIDDDDVNDDDDDNDDDDNDGHCAVPRSLLAYFPDNCQMYTVSGVKRSDSTLDITLTNSNCNFFCKK